MDKISLVLILSSAVTNALGSTIMKHAYGGDSTMVTSGIIGAFLRILLNPWIVLGLGMFGISFFFMAGALSRTDLTLAYPLMSGIVYLILLFVGLFVFKENITVMRVAGMAFILLGITLLTIKSN
ncbi:MAG: SMR family transporter [Synergistaceae bacterium]